MLVVEDKYSALVLRNGLLCDIQPHVLFLKDQSHIYTTPVFEIKSTVLWYITIDILTPGTGLEMSGEPQYFC